MNIDTTKLVPKCDSSCEEDGKLHVLASGETIYKKDGAYIIPRWNIAVFPDAGDRGDRLLPESGRGFRVSRLHADGGANDALPPLGEEGRIAAARCDSQCARPLRCQNVTSKVGHCRDLREVTGKDK